MKETADAGDLQVPPASGSFAFPPALEVLRLTVGPCPYRDTFALDATFSAALGRLQRLGIALGNPRSGLSSNLLMTT